MYWNRWTATQLYALWGLIIVSGLIIASCGLFATTYVHHYAEAVRGAEEARTYLLSDVCTKHRFVVGDFARCAEATQRLGVAPAVRAFDEWCRDWVPCARTGCDWLWLDLRVWMKTIIICAFGLLFLTIVSLLIFVRFQGIWAIQHRTLPGAHIKDQ